MDRLPATTKMLRGTGDGSLWYVTWRLAAAEIESARAVRELPVTFRGRHAVISGDRGEPTGMTSKRAYCSVAQSRVDECNGYCF